MSSIVQIRCNMSIKNSTGAIDSPAISSESNMIAFEAVPLTALSKKTLRILSPLLNAKKIFPSEEGYQRDWRGLARLAEQHYICNETTIGLEDPTIKVIQLWCRNNPKTATFAYLEAFLGIIDRWDAADDIYESLVEDTKTYQMKQQQHSLRLKPNVETRSFNTEFAHDCDSDILTNDDVIYAQKGLPLLMYDAFVLYADADINYATEILTTLEDNPEYGFKLCIKNRDLLPGVVFEHIAITQLIEERCNHLIVILTEEFFKSPENNLLLKFTQALPLNKKLRKGKMLPLLYEDNLDIPKALQIYTLLRYKSNNTSLFNFWSKLARAIRDETSMSNTTASPLNRNPTYGSATENKNKSPSIPNQIPSISIIPPEDNEEPKKKETDHVVLNDGMILRNVHSTGQLHTSYKTNNAISMPDLSTTSTCSEIKKKKKWSTRVLKKIFSGRSCKLQEA